MDFAVVEASQRVGSLMGIKTVAECVEDAAALHGLGRICVDFAQGYHIQQPMPLAQIESLERLVSAEPPMPRARAR